MDSRNGLDEPFLRPEQQDDFFLQLGDSGMTNIGSGEGQLNSAQKYSVERRSWLLGQCRLILRRLGVLDVEDKAEDLTHDVFMLCGSKSDEEWEEVLNPDGYLYTIAKNKARLDLEKCREEATDSEELSRLIDQRPGQNPELAEAMANYVKRLRSELSSDDRELFELVFNEGFRSKEIGKKLGLSDAAVRKRISRMGEKLRCLVEKGDKDPPHRQSQPSAIRDRTDPLPGIAN